MKISEILTKTEHRPWELPEGKWSFYQEWNKAVFLHWKVDPSELKTLVPEELELDLIEGKAWISLVAFTMEKIRPRNLPYFLPVSNFDEINIRTYVKHRNKPGVYFLSIEGGKRLSCMVARHLSELPYRYSNIRRSKTEYSSCNFRSGEILNLNYQVGSSISVKSDLDKWLTERYALFQNTESTINAFSIHHLEWPVFEVNINELILNYPRFSNFISNQPDKVHYSSGVKVIAWGKEKWEKK